MPELPEVQTTVNGLNKHLKKLKIDDVWTDYNSKHHKGKDSIKDPAYFKHFKKVVSGSEIVGAERVAKNILIHLSKDGRKYTVLIHMKMTGHLLYGKYFHDNGANKWQPDETESPALRDPYNRFVHLVFSLSNGKHLALSDTRKFAKVTLLEEKNPRESLHLNEIGPDPINDKFPYKLFSERVNLRPSGKIKQVLMDQTVIAGVGNIYSDESLWRAGIHPESRVSKIDGDKFKSLHKALISVLKRGIDFGGDSMSDYRNIYGEKGEFQEHHKVYQKKGEKCSAPECNGLIIRKIVGGRSSHFCNTHQKLFV